MNKPRETARINPGHFELENFLPYRLSLLTNTISQGIAESYRHHRNISTAEWRVLAVLGRFPGLAAREVVEKTGMDKVAISRAVKNLESKGYLSRKTNQQDRRRQSLFLTSGPGQEVLSEVIPLAHRYQVELLDVLEAGELDSLLTTMEKLQQRAKHLNARTGECSKE